MSGNFLATGLVWYVAFLFSTTCHEAAHALAAKLGGDETAALGGQVTLNPVPHIQREPFGTVLVPIITYMFGGWMMGWASAPYDPIWQARHPHRAAWMALAGPAANFVLLLIAVGLIHLGLSTGIFTIPEYLSFAEIVVPSTTGIWSGAAALVSVLFSLNLILAVFNLIPVPPLDGATAIGLLLPEAQALSVIETLNSPQFSFIGLLIAWRVMDVIFPPIFHSVLRLALF